MLIRDLEGKTGLDRATIRFYEREGLISPERKENGYREYTGEHLDQLLKIRLLRQLGMSLDTIKGLQKGTESFSKALEAQIRMLEQRIQETSRAKDICTELYRANTSYAALDADYYLKLLNKPTQSVTGRSFREPVKRPYHPVRRFLARMMDYVFVRSLLEFILIVLLRIRPYGDLISNIVTYGVLFLMVPVYAYMLHKWGTTPGKWLFGLSVQSENGGHLSYSAAKDREWQVLRDGYGFGIPFWSLWRMYRSWKSYSEWELDWDYESEYMYKDQSRKHNILLTASIAICLCVTMWVAADVVRPRYRGELTIGQYASNYNFYHSLVTEDSDQSSRLQPDGTWYPEQDNHIIVYIDAEPVVPKQNFEFELYEDKIRTVRYKNEWTEIRFLEPFDSTCEMMVLTVLMSQKGNGLTELKEFENILDQADLTQDGMVTYQNIRINWKIVTENCSLIHGAYYSRTDESKESRLQILLEVTILT